MATSRPPLPRGSMAAAPSCCGIAAIGSPKAIERPQASLAAGELKFTLAGKLLAGSWVLVRMKRDRTRSKRTNWLLVAGARRPRPEALHCQNGAGSGRQKQCVARL